MSLTDNMESHYFARCFIRFVYLQINGHFLHFRPETLCKNSWCGKALPHSAAGRDQICRQDSPAAGQSFSAATPMYYLQNLSLLLAFFLNLQISFQKKSSSNAGHVALF